MPLYLPAATSTNREWADQASYDASSALTVSLWIRPRGATTSKFFAVRGTGAGSGGGWSMGGDASQFFTASVRASGIAYTVTGGTAMVVGRLYHVAFRFRSSDNTLAGFVNGQSVGSTTATSGTMAVSATQIRIGQGTGGGTAMEAEYAYLACWSAALTDEQIASLAGGAGAIHPRMIEPGALFLCDDINANSIDTANMARPVDSGNVMSMSWIDDPVRPSMGWIAPFRRSRAAPPQTFNPLLFGRARALGGRVR